MSHSSPENKAAPPDKAALPDTVASPGKATLPGSAPPPSKAMRFWRQVARVTSLGWSNVFLIAGGVLLGQYLDRITGREYVWTVGLLFGGVVMAFFNLYHILYEERID